jgi:hypothetical protein
LYYSTRRGFVKGDFAFFEYFSALFQFLEKQSHPRVWLYENALHSSEKYR